VSDWEECALIISESILLKKSTQPGLATAAPAGPYRQIWHEDIAAPNRAPLSKLGRDLLVDSLIVAQSGEQRVGITRSLRTGDFEEREIKLCEPLPRVLSRSAASARIAGQQQTSIPFSRSSGEQRPWPLSVSSVFVKSLANLFAGRMALGKAAALWARAEGPGSAYIFPDAHPELQARVCPGERGSGMAGVVRAAVTSAPFGQTAAAIRRPQNKRANAESETADYGLKVSRRDRSQA